MTTMPFSAYLKRMKESDETPAERTARLEKERRAEQNKKYYLKNENKIKARRATQRAVKNGELPPATSFQCRVCEVYRADEYHHWSYHELNWLSVIPLCSSCHGRVTRGVVKILYKNKKIVTPYTKCTQ